ncbi:nuclear transport factor 2 family protein [Nostocoides australiense]
MDAAERRAIEHDCAALVMRYANGKDAADWDLVARLFAADGRMSRPTAPDDFIEGRDAILAAFRARPARTTRHVTSNVVIDVESATSARGECALVLYTAHKAPIRRLLPRPLRADLGLLAIRGAARLADLCSRDRRACVKAGPGLHMVPARVIGHNVT